MVDVINNLNNPLAIASYKGVPNEYRIYTYATINGKNICIGVNVSLQNGSIELSNIISAYGRDINNLLGKEGLYLLYPYINELKRRILQVSTGPNSPLNATSTASADKGNTKSANSQATDEILSQQDSDEGGAGHWALNVIVAIYYIFKNIYYIESLHYKLKSYICKLLHFGAKCFIKTK